MLPEFEACASHDICSVKKMKNNNKWYYSSKKASEKSRMKMAYKEFKLRGLSKLLDFTNVDVADIAGVTEVVL
jgi:hypothetical protein